jgi:hypothetical protein
MIFFTNIKKFRVEPKLHYKEKKIMKETNKQPVLVVHPGVFHADDCSCVSLLRMLPEFVIYKRFFNVF